MTSRITLTTPQTEVVAGFQFVDGIAEVEILGDNAREFFRVHGAVIEEVSPEGDSFDTMTIAKLREYAAAQTPPIELPASAKVAELRELVKTAAASRAGAPAPVTAEEGTAAAAAVAGPETGAHAEETPAVEAAQADAAESTEGE